MFYKNNLFALLVGCSAIGIQAADERDRILRMIDQEIALTDDFDYAKHTTEALALVKENIDSLGKLPGDPEKRTAEIERLTEKFDACLYNKYHMSSATKIATGSLRRIVLLRNDRVIGLADGFVRAECEKFYPNKGYIETVCVAKEHKNQYSLLMRAIIKKIENALYIRGEWGNTGDKQAHIITHVADHDADGQKVCRDLGFTILEQTEHEKKGGSIPFQLIKQF